MSEVADGPFTDYGATGRESVRVGEISLKDGWTGSSAGRGFIASHCLALLSGVADQLLTAAGRMGCTLRWDSRGRHDGGASSGDVAAWSGFAACT